MQSGDFLRVVRALHKAASRFRDTRQGGFGRPSEDIAMSNEAPSDRPPRRRPRIGIMIAATISVAPAIMLASPLHAHVSGNCTVQNSDGYANVRSRPTTHAPILLQLKNGTRVSAYDVHHRWLWIKGTIGTKETVTGWTRRWALSCDKPLRWR
jgi:hypothetical protein